MRFHKNILRVGSFAESKEEKSSWQKMLFTFGCVKKLVNSADENEIDKKILIGLIGEKAFRLLYKID